MPNRKQHRPKQTSWDSSVPLNFWCGTVRVVPVFGLDGSPERVFSLFQYLRERCGVAVIFHSLVFWISLVFSKQGDPLVFWAFSVVFPGFSGFRRGTDPFGVWAVFLGFYQKTKEWKIKLGKTVPTVPVSVRFHAPRYRIPMHCE